MVLRVGIEKSANHPLILRIMFPRLVFKKFYAPLAQRNRDLYSFIPED
jgi:hypothetical protein